MNLPSKSGGWKSWCFGNPGIPQCSNQSPSGGRRDHLVAAQDGKQRRNEGDWCGWGGNCMLLFCFSEYGPTSSLYLDDMTTCGILMMTSKNVGHPKLDCFLHVESLKVFPWQQSCKLFGDLILQSALWAVRMLFHWRKKTRMIGCLIFAYHLNSKIFPTPSWPPGGSFATSFDWEADGDWFPSSMACWCLQDTDGEFPYNWRKQNAKDDSKKSQLRFHEGNWMHCCWWTTSCTSSYPVDTIDVWFRKMKRSKFVFWISDSPRLPTLQGSTHPHQPPPTSTNLQASSRICSEAATAVGLGNVESLAAMGEAFGGQAGHRDTPKKRGQWYD